MAASNVSQLHQSPAPSTVLVRFDRVYGLVKCYPANEAAQQLCRLTGTKTLSSDNLKAARALGLEVIVDYQSWAVLEQFLGGGA